MLSAHPPAAYGLAALGKGAAGYLNKQCEPGEIVKAIVTVASGRRYLDEEMKSLLAAGPAREAGVDLHRRLTEREFQIFLRLAQGQDNGQVAADLSLSPRTVLTYRHRLLAKMHVRTNSDLTYYALKHGLIA